jgi:hypothetical protein
MILPFRELSQPLCDCVLNASCSRFLDVVNVMPNGLCGSLSVDFAVHLCGCSLLWLMPFSIVIQKSGRRCHCSIDFLVFFHYAVLWSDELSDPRVMMWRSLLSHNCTYSMI